MIISQSPPGLPDVVEVPADLALLRGRAVHRRQLPIGQLGQGFRQQARLQGPRDAGAFAVEPSVLDGQRCTLGDLFGELDVARVEGAARFGADKRDRPDRPAPDLHRHEECSAQPDLAQQLEMALVHGRGPQRLLGDLVEERGLAGRDHAPDPAVGLYLLGLVFAQARGQLDPRRVDVGDCDGLPVPFFVDEVDAAPVGELRHGEAGDVLQCLPVVERGRQQRRGAREELAAQLQPLALGDVLDDRHRRVDRPLLVSHGGRLEQHPALVARRLVDRAQKHRLGLLLAAQQPHRGQVFHLHVRAVLGRDLVAPISARGSAAASSDTEVRPRLSRAARFA